MTSIRRRASPLKTTNMLHVVAVARYKTHHNNVFRRNQSEMRVCVCVSEEKAISLFLLSTKFRMEDARASAIYAKGNDMPNSICDATRSSNKSWRKTKMDCRLNAKLPSFSWYFNACVRFKHVINLHAMTSMQQQQQHLVKSRRATMTTKPGPANERRKKK